MTELSPEELATIGGAIALRAAAKSIRYLRDKGFAWTVDEIVEHLDNVADDMEKLQS